MKIRNVDAEYTFRGRLPRWLAKLVLSRIEKVVISKKGTVITEYIIDPAPQAIKESDE